MKKIIYIFILVLLSLNMKAINSKKLAKKIAKKELSMKMPSRFNMPVYKRILVDIDFVKLLNPNFSNDTLFILHDGDRCEGGTASYFPIAVCNRRKIFYFFKKDTLTNKFDYDLMPLYRADKEYQVFDDYMVSLVTEWNIKRIKKEAERWLDGSPTIAIRVIFKHKKSKIECISFDEIFDYKRDVLPYPYKYHPEYAQLYKIDKKEKKKNKK